MTKKEMIEEMAEDWDYVAHMLRFNDCYMLSLKKWSEPAREMIKLGWIKPNKNLVVLSKEEYEKLKQYEEKVKSGACFTQKEWLEFCDEECKRNSENLSKALQLARKETAREFADKVKMAFYYEFDELIPSIMADKIDKIADEFGVDEEK